MLLVDAPLGLPIENDNTDPTIHSRCGILFDQAHGGRKANNTLDLAFVHSTVHELFAGGIGSIGG